MDEGGWTRGGGAGQPAAVRKFLHQRRAEDDLQWGPENNGAFFHRVQRVSLPAGVLVVVEEVVEAVRAVVLGVTFAFLALLPEGQAGRVDGRAGTHSSRLTHCGAERAQRKNVSRFKNDTK